MTFTVRKYIKYLTIDDDTIDSKNYRPIFTKKCIEFIIINGIKCLYLLENISRLNLIDLYKLSLKKGYKYGNTEIIKSFRYGSLEIVSLLYKDLNKIDMCTTNYAITEACIGNNVQVLDYLFPTCKEYIDMDGYDQNSAFYACIEGFIKGGHYELYKKYMKEEYEIFDEYVYYACKSGSVEMVNEFISKGFEMGEYDIGCACESGSIELFENMMKMSNSSYLKFLEEACYSENIKMVSYILDKEYHKDITIFKNKLIYGLDLEIVKYLFINGIKFGNDLIEIDNKYVEYYLYKKGLCKNKNKLFTIQKFKKNLKI